MSRYIKADMIGCPCGYCEGYRECQKEVDTAPSIDIVFCRECKWFDKDNLGDTYCTWSKGLCDAKPDDFCSYGERSE